MNWERTKEVIPSGVQTLSKMPNKHVEGVYPKYLVKGEGAYVWDDEDNKYLDYPCGLGSVLLGYNHPIINRAIIDQIEKGVIFSLPNPLETVLAEKILELLPSADMCRFFKNGSDATEIAVRIARAATGKNSVIACGYHGFHDWYNWTTSMNKGVQSQSVVQCDYNAIEQFITVFESRRKIAAVIMEPYILEPPRKEFLNKVRKLCSRYGALLIFDEIVTGFRTPDYFASEYFKVTPDLTCLGKGMGNGLPISAVCGKRKYMQELEGDCFASSTFGGELLSIAAAIATIDFMKDNLVIDHIWRMGERIRSSFESMVLSYGLEGAGIIGYAPRTFFVFPTETHKSLFWQECLKRGVLFGYAQFISHSHGLNEVDTTISVMRDALYLCKKHWKKPDKMLEGRAAQQTIRQKIGKDVT